MKPHQRKHARWFETFGCGSSSRATSSPTESSPSSRSSSRMRTRIGSPRPRKYFATRSLRAGASGRRKGASSTDTGISPHVSTDIDIRTHRYDVGHHHVHTLLMARLDLERLAKGLI